MFTILQKPQDSVSAEDLETLQNEIERTLVDVVTQKWQLEEELVALNNNNSPDNEKNPLAQQSSSTTSITSANSTTTTTTTSTTSTTSTTLATQNHPNASSISGKLRNSSRLNPVDTTDNSSDGFKSMQINANNYNALAGSGTNSGDDSVSSAGSLISNLTSSTIITANQGDGSQTASSLIGSSLGGTKRAHKSTNSDNSRPSKRFRQNSNNSLTNTGALAKRPPHSKHRSKIVPSKFRSSLDESRTHNKKHVPRNEAPDKLWPFVEQFCSTPTMAQLHELQEMINALEEDKDYFKVPTLGKKETSTKESPNKTEVSTPTSANKNQRKTKSRNGSEEESSGLGALTQRLVSSFMEESDDNGSDISKSGTNDGSQSAKKRNTTKLRGGKNIDINNAKNLERRIREELEEYDILDQQDDIPYTSEEDEILRELVSCQRELLTVQSENKELMQRLLKRAKKHIELEDEREKLLEANEDVIAAYYRLIQAKQRKRNPTKKEKDVAWKALKVHGAIFKRCDDLYLSSLNRGGNV